jgi:hypothetical protein
MGKEEFRSCRSSGVAEPGRKNSDILTFSTALSVLNS